MHCEPGPSQIDLRPSALFIVDQNTPWMMVKSLSECYLTPSNRSAPAHRITGLTELLHPLKKHTNGDTTHFHMQPHFPLHFVRKKEAIPRCLPAPPPEPVYSRSPPPDRGRRCALRRPRARCASGFGQLRSLRPSGPAAADPRSMRPACARSGAPCALCDADASDKRNFVMNVLLTLECTRGVLGAAAAERVPGTFRTYPPVFRVLLLLSTSY